MSKCCKDAVIQDYLRGIRVREIAKTHGVSRSRVYQLINDLTDAPRLLNSFEWHDEGKCRDIYRRCGEGESYSQVAATLGLSKNQVAGIVYRERHRQ